MISVLGDGSPPGTQGPASPMLHSLCCLQFLSSSSICYPSHQSVFLDYLHGTETSGQFRGWSRRREGISAVFSWLFWPCMVQYQNACSHHSRVLLPSHWSLCSLYSTSKPHLCWSGTLAAAQRSKQWAWRSKNPPTFRRYTCSWEESQWQCHCRWTLCIWVPHPQDDSCLNTLHTST